MSVKVMGLVWDIPTKSPTAEEFIERGWSPEGAEFMASHPLRGTGRWIRGERVEAQCSHCGYQGSALDRHHVHGRKNSPLTIVLCANCHRELHAGEWSLT